VGRRFFEEILDARFVAVKKGSRDALLRMLGEHPHEAGFGSYILDQSRPGDSRFYGFSLLCSLCSGDLSVILELLRALAQGKWDAAIEPIPASEQDRIVKDFAQRHPLYMAS